MNLAFGSLRTTSDVDFTTEADPLAFATQLRDALDKGMARAAAELGYTDFVCRVQTVKQRPAEFHEANFPALKVKVAYAQRGSNEERRLLQGYGTQVLSMDINFNEPVKNLDKIILEEERTIESYSLIELVAEKLRALLQQPIRNRSRRQDVYDLAYLIEHWPLDDGERYELLHILKAKAESRGIFPGPDSLSHPEVVRRASEHWATMEQELDRLPDFDSCFNVVEQFYRALPWDAISLRL